MISHIPYKGNLYPVRVSYYALKQFELETGLKADQLDEKTSNLEVLLWYSLIAGAKATNAQLLLDRSECEFILDESLAEFNKAIIESFMPSTGEDKKK